jgi:hypothetical protein
MPGAWGFEERSEPVGDPSLKPYSPLGMVLDTSHGSPHGSLNGSLNKSLSLKKEEIDKLRLRIEKLAQQVTQPNSAKDGAEASFGKDGKEDWLRLKMRAEMLAKRIGDNSKQVVSSTDATSSSIGMEQQNSYQENSVASPSAPSAAAEERSFAQVTVSLFLADVYLPVSCARCRRLSMSCFVRNHD